MDRDHVADAGRKLNPDRLSLLAGRRDHLEAGDSIADFLEGFPSVKREQVLALLEESKAQAMAHQ